MKRFLVFVPVLLLLLASLAAAQTRTYTVEDLLRVRRVDNPRVSPDGRQVVFTIGDVNYDANKFVTQIYVTSIAGGEIKRLTSADTSSSAPRWSPDGKKIAYGNGGHICGVDHHGEHKEQE